MVFLQLQANNNINHEIQTLVPDDYDIKGQQRRQLHSTAC